METAQDHYVRTHSTTQSEALAWIERQTNIRTNYPRMLSGAVQGRLLTMMAEMTGAAKILEIGTFTGYSAACLAYGLAEGGHVDTLEINDELEDLIREGWDRAGLSDRIELHIGDAKQTLQDFKEAGKQFDLVFIDANKREYCEYYDLMFDMIVPGGVILVDDVLWDGKVYEEPMPQDKQTLGISEFNDKVASDPRVEVVMLPSRHGLSIIRKK